MWQQLHQQLLRACLESQVERFELGGQVFAQLCLELSCPLDYVDLFCCYQNDWKVLWRGRNEQQIAVGYGSAFFSDDFEWLSSLGHSADQPRLYGGLSFDDYSAERKAFSRPYFFLPMIEWRSCEHDKHTFWLRWEVEVVGALSRDFLIQRLNSLKPNLQRQVYQQPLLYAQRSDPCFNDWCDRVARIKSAFHDSELEKVVLSRLETLETTLQPRQLLQHLMRLGEQSYTFAFADPSGVLFVSRSPERLLAWQNSTCYTEAIAGTRKRGRYDSEDMLQEHTLASSHKDRLEHGLVVDFIDAVLQHYCTDVSHAAHSTVLKLKHVQHLKQGFQGRLKSGYKPHQLLQALHPTPAVSGMPQQLSKSWLRQLEPFHRGWFAGSVGWYEAGQGDFAVAIRSATLDRGCLKIFAGAGIVADSQAEAEWLETAAKMSHFLELWPEDAVATAQETHDAMVEKL